MFGHEYKTEDMYCYFPVDKEFFIFKQYGPVLPLTYIKHSRATLREHEIILN